MSGEPGRRRQLQAGHEKAWLGRPVSIRARIRLAGAGKRMQAERVQCAPQAALAGAIRGVGKPVRARVAGADEHPLALPVGTQPAVEARMAAADAQFDATDGRRGGIGRRQVGAQQIGGQRHGGGRRGLAGFGQRP